MTKRNQWGWWCKRCGYCITGLVGLEVWRMWNRYGGYDNTMKVRKTNANEKLKVNLGNGEEIKVIVYQVMRWNQLVLFYFAMKKQIKVIYELKKDYVFLVVARRIAGMQDL